jgi:hypothetical protein
MGTHLTRVQGKKKHKETPPKEKIKANNQQKLSTKPYAKRTREYKMTMNNNKENLRQKSYHLSQFNYYRRCTNYNVYQNPPRMALSYLA